MLRSKSTSTRARGTSTISRGSSSSRGRGRGAHGPSNSLPNANSSDPFEADRLENAAKREQKGQESTATNSRGGRGTSRGRYQNKSVRFASPPIQPPKETNTANASPFIVTNGTPSPFANATPNVFNTGVTSSGSHFNPFASASGTGGASSNTSITASGWNPFGTASSVETPQVDPFDSTQVTNGTQKPSAFGAPFGTNPLSNPAKSSYENITRFGTNPFSSSSPSNAISNPLSTTKPNTSGNGSKLFLAGTPSSQRQSEGNLTSLFPQAVVNNPVPTADYPLNSSKNKLATEIDNLLRKNGIIAPSWPTTTPGDPSLKGAVEAFWQNMKAYRARVRTCLIRNGYLDDPDKPKKLSEAIDFKGTCEDMCPEFEKVTRIVEHDVQSAEKELSPNGQTQWPALHKMVKALARSAAGQDAPLPEDVRCPAALRRTLDYLIDSVLGTNDLPAVHGFLWDRTRAIRRDFVFQQSSMTSQELLDQVYCLEQITRFHVVALHQMSHEDVIAEDFSEQQEVEQLGKALLSLIHAYEDCIAQGIHSDNEPEFRAYYILFNSHNTGILEAVQDWGWEYWGKSDDIRTAVSLVETLQNIWDMQGPLKPHSAMDIAQNAYHRFFSIIENPKVSYTMACFAEIHFNKVRKAALKTILASYRKQRDQTTDWTLDRLNAYLHFDNEDDIVTFGEAYGVHFDILNGQQCLSFESDDHMEDPFPKLKQPHSYKLVERKRGEHILSELIHYTVYEEKTDEATEEDDMNSLFVPASSENPVQQSTLPRSRFTDNSLDLLDDPLLDDGSFPDPKASENLYQKESAGLQTTKHQNDSHDRIVSSSSVGTIAAVTDNSRGDIATTGSKAAVAGESKFMGSTSTFENKPIAPQKNIFSFLDQNKNDDSRYSSSGSTPSFPTLLTNKATEVSVSTIPANSKPLFSLQGSTGGFPSSPSASALPAPIINVKESRPVPEATKEVPDRKTEGNSAHSDQEEAKQQLINRTSKNSSKIHGDRASATNAPTKSKMAAFAEWVALGKNGVIDEFTEAIVEQILMQTVKKYVADEKRRLLQEEEKRSREEAANFRFKFLATKYFYSWRDIAHRLWMRRKGRLARQARREMAEESFRTSHATEKNDVVDEIRAYGLAKKQNMEQSLIYARDNSPSQKDNKRVPRRPKKGSPLANSDKSGSPGQSQTTSDDLLRKSLLSDSAYLQGGSRIHLIPNYRPSMESRRQPNGVKTDYFRLKARGIMTLPDGTPLANTAAVHLSHKRSLDNISKSLTPERPISKPTASSVPSKPVANGVSSSGPGAEHENEIEALKARARAVMANDKEEKQNVKKRGLDDDEAELFASAKRLRDKMDEEILWMKAETQRSMSRSSS